jgi:hypothetical protein
MTLNASGPISLGGATTGQSINLELSQISTATISLNDTNVRTLAGVSSGAITMPTNFWGKSAGSYWLMQIHNPVATTQSYNNVADGYVFANDATNYYFSSGGSPAPGGACFLMSFNKDGGVVNQRIVTGAFAGGVKLSNLNTSTVYSFGARTTTIGLFGTVDPSTLVVTPQYCPSIGGGFTGVSFAQFNRFPDGTFLMNTGKSPVPRSYIGYLNSSYTYQGVSTFQLSAGLENLIYNPNTDRMMFGRGSTPAPATSGSIYIVGKTPLGDSATYSAFNISASGQTYGTSFGMTFDTSGNMYTICLTRHAGPTYYVSIVKTDASNNVVWSKSISAPDANSIPGSAVVIGSSLYWAYCAGQKIYRFDTSTGNVLNELQLTINGNTSNVNSLNIFCKRGYASDEALFLILNPLGNSSAVLKLNPALNQIFSISATTGSVTNTYATSVPSPTTFSSLTFTYNSTTRVGDNNGVNYLTGALGSNTFSPASLATSTTSV